MRAVMSLLAACSGGPAQDKVGIGSAPVRGCSADDSGVRNVCTQQPLEELPAGLLRADQAVGGSGRLRADRPGVRHLQVDLGGPLELQEEADRGVNRRADGERTVVAQDYGLRRPEGGGDALAARGRGDVDLLV